MNSKHVADGEGPKFGKLMPNQLSKFQHPDAPKQKFKKQIRRKTSSGSKHCSSFSHPSLPGGGGGTSRATQDIQPQGRKFILYFSYQMLGPVNLFLWLIRQNIYVFVLSFNWPG